MKKSYKTPSVEKVEFQYDQVVVASDSSCIGVWINKGAAFCEEGNEEQAWLSTRV